MERLARRLDGGLERRHRALRACPGMSPASARASSSSARPGPLRNGGEAEAAHAPELEAAIHVALVNRGVLIAPFHNMMLISPATTRRAGRPADRRLRRYCGEACGVREAAMDNLECHHDLTFRLHDRRGEGLSRRPSRDRSLRHRADRRQRRRARQDHPPARTAGHLRGRPAPADLDPRPRHHRRGCARDRADLGFRRRRPARLADPRHAGAAARHQPGRAARC